MKLTFAHFLYALPLCLTACQQRGSTLVYNYPRFGFPQDVEMCIDLIANHYSMQEFEEPTENLEFSLRYLFRYAIEKDRPDVAYMVGKKLYELRETSRVKDPEGQQLLSVLLDACRYAAHGWSVEDKGKLEKVAQKGDEHAILVLGLVHLGLYDSQAWLEKLPDDDFYSYYKQNPDKLPDHKLMLHYLKQLMAGELRDMAQNIETFPVWYDCRKQVFNPKKDYSYTTWPIRNRYR